jgi:hypothetical protein
MQTGKGSVTGRAGEPKGNLEGVLAHLHDSQKNEGKRLGSESRFHKASLIVAKLRTLGDLMFFGGGYLGRSPNSRDCGGLGL